MEGWNVAVWVTLGGVKERGFSSDFEAGVSIYLTESSTAKGKFYGFTATLNVSQGVYDGLKMKYESDVPKRWGGKKLWSGQPVIAKFEDWLNADAKA